MKMKLALVFQRFVPDTGAERVMENTLKTAADAGIEVTVISEPVKFSGITPARVIQIPTALGSRTRRFFAFQSAVADVLARHANEFDIVQAHEIVSGAHIYRAGGGVHAAWFHRLKNQRPWWRQQLMAFDSSHRLRTETEQQIAWHSDTIFVAISQMVADEITEWLGLPESRIRIIENGVDLSRFRPPTAGERATARTQYHLSADEPVIAYIGTGFERKGAFELVRAMSVSSLREAKVLIAGADKRIRALVALAKKLGVADRVTILGSIQNVLPVLHAADIFVLPTLYDAGAIAILEALACGLPVVTTADAGHGRIAVENGAGCFCSRHVDSLADAIGKTFSQQQKQRQAAIRLRDKFYPTHTSQKWLDLYKELIK